MAGAVSFSVTGLRSTDYLLRLFHDGTKVDRF